MTSGAPVPVRTLKLTVAYDGTAYAGWQFQPGKPTVQDTLENAIEKVTGRRVRVLASGRTDAGVHALGQVVAFRTDSTLTPEVLRRAINANLPHDVAVLDVAEVPKNFRPIAHAVRKRYRYVIHDGPVRDVFTRHFAWHYSYGRLDAEAMQRAAAALLGTHDFRSFQSSGAERKTSVRTIFELRVERGGTADLPSPDQPSVGARRGAGGEGGAEGKGRAGEGEKEGLGIRDWELKIGDNCNTPRQRSRGVCSPDSEDFIIIEIEADGFLYNMVRAIVGTLVQVGRGARPEGWPGEVLQAADRRVAGPTAPPQGLCLVKVEY